MTPIKNNTTTSSNNMQQLSLEECLNKLISTSYHNRTTIQATTKAMVQIVEQWIIQNPSTYDSSWLENTPQFTNNTELPYIHHTHCPIHSTSTETITDIGGRIRCFHVDTKLLRPEYTTTEKYFDKPSQTIKKRINENIPQDPRKEWVEQCEECELYEECEDNCTIYDLLDIHDNHTSKAELELDKYLDEKEKYDATKPTLEVKNTCYAIISDRNSILSLETVLERLSEHPSWKIEADDPSSDHTLFQYSLKELILYIKKWHDQTQQLPPLYNQTYSSPTEQKLIIQARLLGDRTYHKS